MSQDIIEYNFSFENQNLTVAVDEKGELWFSAENLAEILGYSHTPYTVRMLDEDERCVFQVDRKGFICESTFISESGLYAVIYRSEQSNVKAFCKWVMSEVLLSLRKTGSYSMQSKAEMRSKINQQSVFQHIQGLTLYYENIWKKDQRKIKELRSETAKLNNHFNKQISKLLNEAEKLKQENSGLREQLAHSKGLLKVSQFPIECYAFDADQV